MFKVCNLCCSALIAVATFADHCPAQSPDAVFLAGLRQRRLFELAERHCVERLADKRVVEPLRTELLVERIRTLATWAVHAPAEESAGLWKSARQAAAEAIRAKPPSPRLVLVRIQDALTPLAAGELGQQEFEAGALPENHLEPTRELLREASDLLESIDKELTAQIPLRRRDPPHGGLLGGDALSSLQQQVRQQLARAYRNRALVFPAGSDDRLALLLRASETLQSALSQIAADDQLARAVQLDLAECQRLLGRHNEAEQRLADLNRDGVEPAVRLRAVAELIRLAIAQNDTAAAERLMEQGREIDGQSGAELDFAWFEAQLALARAATRAKDAAAAGRYQGQAAESARQLETAHGPYWGRRANQLLVKSLPPGAGVVNASLLSRAADTLYLQRQFDRAIVAYDDAAAQARTSGDLATSFELSYKAALVERSRKDHVAAARRLRTLSKGLATHSEAPAAHLSAAWHAAQLVKDDPAAAAAYEAILREHLASWPSHESTAQARVWLGRLLEGQDRSQEAASVYALVPRASEHFAAAIEGLARASREHLGGLAAAGEPTSEPAARAFDKLRQVIAASKAGQPATWTDADRAAAIAAAELLLAYLPGRAVEAERLLQSALDSLPEAAVSSSWHAAARSQLVVALANQPGRHDDGMRVLHDVAAGPAEDLLALLTGLAAVMERAPSGQRERLAELQLVAVEALHPRRAQLDRQQQRMLDRVQAEALSTAGRRAEAIAAYKALAAADPDSARIQEGYARLLLAGDDKESLEAALAQWRTIASRSRPRTDGWYEAKYSIAQAQLKLGDSAGALALASYMLAAPPGLVGTRWEQRFTELLKQSEPAGDPPR